PQTRERLEALLTPDPSSTSGTHPDPEPSRAAIIDLLADSGPPGLNSLLEEITKLDHIRALGLPAKLFEDISRQVLHSYRQRLAVEAPYELRRHAMPLRLTHPLPALLVVPVAPPGSRLVFCQDREAEHPAPGGQDESSGRDLRELHTAWTGEVEISFARDE